MSWQDSFVPDNGTPQAVQANGWQSSFVPDSNAQQPESNSTASMQNVAPNPAAQNGNISEDQQLTPAQKMYQYFSDKPGTKYGDIVPLSVNEKTGENSFDFPELIRGPARGLAELLGQSAGEIKPQTDTSTGVEGSLSPDEINALALLSPVSPASHSIAFGQHLANTVESTAKAASDILPDAITDEYTRTQQQEMPTIAPTNSDLKLISQKLDLAGITPQQYADALTNSSPTEFAAEVGGDPLRLQAQTYAKLQGPTMQAARDAMRQRLAEAPQRVQGLIDNTFTSQPNIERLQDNVAGMQQAASDAYKAAFQSNVPISHFSDVINTPSGQTALKQTAIDFANGGKTPEDMGLSLGEDGKYSLNDSVPIETIHQIQRNIGTQVQRDPFGNTLTTPGNQVLESQQAGITSKLAQLNPDYNKALNNAAAYKQAQAAFDAGRKLGISSAGDNADQLMDRAANVYSPNELAYHKAGFAQGLTDKVQGAPLGTGNPATRISSGFIVPKSAEVLDNPGQAQAFGDALVREKQMMDFANRGLNNSVTAETASAGLPEIPTSAHGVALSAASKIGDLLNAGKNQRMSQLLFATSPQQKSALANAIIRYNQ